MGNNENKEYYSELFKDYPDVVRVYQLKEMLPKTGKNKIYKLLKMDILNLLNKKLYIFQKT